MKHDRLILCGGASAPRGVRAERLHLAIDFEGRPGNVFLKIKNITEALNRNPSPVLLDLLDVAAYVYAGDQCVPRGGTHSFDYGDRWDRRLRYVIPLRKPKIWNRAQVKDALADVLGWMTDDQFEFRFPELKNPPKLPSYLDFDKGTPNPTGIEEICLFSGGLDSLAGAVQEAVVDGRKVALVGHCPAPQLHKRQAQLLQALAAKCKPANRPFFVQVWANKSSKLTKDTSQRVRSFLYASLGAVIAGMFQLGRIRFYENGPVSLNLPICEQLVGARVTRTTHPKTLVGMSKLLSLLLDTDFAVENPFLWKTRTDTVLDLKAAKAADLIPYTVSCSHTRGMTTGYPHCGCCSQCIDRRFAVLAAGCGGHDPADSYQLDVLTDGRDKTEDRTMLERYLAFATKVEGAQDEHAFFTEFPEAYRTVNAMDGDRRESAKRIVALCKRHGEQVNGVIDEGLAEIAARGALRRGEYPATCAYMLSLDRCAELLTREGKPTDDGGTTEPDSEAGPPQQSDLRAVMTDMVRGIVDGAQTASEEGKDGPVVEDRQLPRRSAKVWADFQDAIVKGKFNHSPPRDREVYDWILIHQREGADLPKFPTWQRYLREARKFHGLQKNTSRGGRATGSSIDTETGAKPIHETEREHRIKRSINQTD